MAATDIRPISAALYLHPIATRVPLKFGSEVLTEVQVAHVELEVVGRDGRRARGRGETPLNVQWAWPSSRPYAERFHAMRALCVSLTRGWADTDVWGHPIEVGYAVDRDVLPATAGSVPRLAALVCNAAFDIALHDAFGRLHGIDVYETYGRRWMNHDLAWYFADDPRASLFEGRYPDHFLLPAPAVPRRLPVWHLVGGLDPIDTDDLAGDEPRDGHPVLLRDWIRRDGLRCLKVKLRGTDPAWDFERLVNVGQVALECDVPYLCADFNCTVTDPDVVIDTLDTLRRDHPAIAGRLLYVEQPFPADLEERRLDVHELSARVPLFLDESAHDWQHVRLGHALGWNGVALKTCKTQSGALLAHCWARAHGLRIMVQDLTNPMLAMIPHVRLAAHAGTLMGVECNAAQFYPDGSMAEARVHPGLYARRDGMVDLSTISGAGFGYRDDDVGRQWRDPVAVAT